MLTLKQVFNQVKKIEFNSRNLVDQLLSGSQYSCFKGTGLEFYDLKEYVLGDDIRRIDPKTILKYNKNCIRRYVEEKKMEVKFLFDVSSSFGLGVPISKKDKSICLIASIIFAALRKDASIGLMFFSNKIDKEFVSVSGKIQSINIIRQLLSYKVSNGEKTDLKKVLREFNKKNKNRCILFIVSDFRCSISFLELKLMSKKHDIIPIIVNDNIEKNVSRDIKSIEDPESGRKIHINRYNRHLLNQFVNGDNNNKKSIISSFYEIGVNPLMINIDEEYEYALKTFFRKKYNGET